MDDTPSYIGSTDKKPSKKKTIWLVIIILALIASNVAWALFYIKQQGELNTTVTTLNARNAKLAKDNKSLRAASESSDSESDYREIPELGVKYKVTDDLKDMTYSYEHANYISLSQYKLQDKTQALDWSDKCGEPLTPSGAITKWQPGQTYTAEGDDTPIEKVNGVKKIGAIYYLYEEVAPAVRQNCEASIKASSVKAKNIFNSLQAVN